jgi:hypothetical protein
MRQGLYGTYLFRVAAGWRAEIGDPALVHALRVRTPPRTMAVRPKPCCSRIRALLAQFGILVRKLGWNLVEFSGNGVGFSNPRGSHVD